MVIDEAEYITFSRNGARFVVPTNPGPYPTTVDADKVIRERQIAEHKAECIEYETYLGVENFIRRMIVKSLDQEWLAEVESETMGFNHLSPKDLLTHLRNVGGSLDHMDVTELDDATHLRLAVGTGSAKWGFKPGCRRVRTTRSGRRSWRA